MWTALRAAELEPGARIVLLEQDICGGGPSGRNGGFVTGWWDELPALAQMYGEAGALECCREVAASVAGIGAWCDGHGVDAWYTPGGYLSVSTNTAQDGGWRSATELAERLGVADRYRELDPQEIQVRCASPAFRGGVLMAD